MPMIYGQSPPSFGVMPAQVPKPTPIRRIYAQKTTKNKSFLDMHHYLKSIGIKNNEFMLTLIDPDLDGVDPYDPNLNQLYKQKILRECITNYWLTPYGNALYYGNIVCVLFLIAGTT